MGELVIVGLGPGSPEQLTPEARAWLTGGAPVLLRTRRHPTLTAWPAAANWASCDDLYEAAPDFAALYAAVLARVREWLARASGPVVYAVPGHPLFAEATVRALLAAGPAARVVPGLSLLDAAAAALGRDPIAEGWQLLDALDLVEIGAGEPFAGGRLPYLTTRPALIAQLHDRRVASGVKLSLMRLLPDDYPVTLVRAAGVAGEERLRELPLHELDRADEHADHLTSLYLPAQAPLAAGRLPQTLARIIAQLRAPGGCPWDREQTHRSLLPHVVEEAYEVVEAIEADDPAALREELGDLLLQVALHAQVAEEAGEFLLEDVIEGLCAKLLRRHPHVFGAVSVAGSAEVLRNWEQIKADERRAKGEDAGAPSPFAGLPRALPALSRAAAIQDRAGRLGQSPPEASILVAQATAAIEQAREADGSEAAAEALGRALVSLVGLAGRLGVDPEAALRAASNEVVRAVEAEMGSPGATLG